MLDISFGLIVLTAVVFFVLVFLLNSWLYRPLMEYMQERERSIQEDLEKAKENESGSQHILAEAQAIVAEAKAQANSMKSEAVAKIKDEMAQLIAQKRAELEEKQAALLQELAEEEKSIKSALISQMPLFKEALKAKFNKL
ncbi:MULTISPECIES: hypothetical protein [unclassified Nitratiruptor]|uniref:F0F1 ATP synthase subunit B family protein n=1 Tax=unclassified Nitratiruptor TaxID=2624044 RepID=UPI00191581FD|nr:MULTISPECIES: hypothetical protein [unclassified Nitratiruptor]BCD60052.1 F-type H+-transporting ATPase subunit b [Nitratiruptor sp. YY08-10]BCD64459.1 F-type H+-transporting ATPase subunit b [Nitratiruptor sp. YY08-14]